MTHVQLFAQIFDAASLTAFQLLQKRNGYTKSQIELALFADVATPIYTKAIDTLPQEWEAALQATVSNQTLAEFVKAQAWAIGDKVAEAYHDEIMWRD